MAAPSKFFTVTGLQAACQNVTGSACGSQADFLVLTFVAFRLVSSEPNSSIELPKL
jgi:hypothetical protein